MLSHVSSRELALWRAYEKYEGPVGPIYERAALRAIASMLNGDENAKPFPDPVEFMKPAPRAEHEDDVYNQAQREVVGVVELAPEPEAPTPTADEEVTTDHEAFFAGRLTP